ncbi:DUF4254 domain-containing protein [Nocardia sp. NEAU-351]|uniref:DUF4254 domain-containing protein n=2 Tax=Nocardia bovistercoris TaxID=2785916 RepID=A0A931N3E0_9NOCA|nr:DUF4254 domain-containing protein [Nocardia bovistercoris]
MTTEYLGSRIGIGALPPCSALLRAFGESVDRPEHSILEVARELAECHERRYRAVLAARAPGASSGVIAAGARLLDDIDRRRGELVGRIDRWVAANIAHRAGASLHTETLGAVIDRLASKWIVAQRALGAKAMSERPPGLEGEAHLHWTRLAELADGYQDLITDVIEHRRRLPVW